MTAVQAPASAAKDPLVSLTPNLHVPLSRAIQWCQGTRPLDGMDASAFFQSGVEVGLLTQQKALELHRRHLLLTRLEEAAASGLELCETCHSAPPAGFTCNSCSAVGAAGTGGGQG